MILTFLNTLKEKVFYFFAKKKRRLGTAKGLIEISDNFDLPLSEFDEYM